MPFGLTFFRTRRQIILKHADLRILRRIAAFLLVVLSIAGIAACTVPKEVFPPDTPTAAISDVLHTTEPTEIGTAAEIELSAKPANTVPVMKLLCTSTFSDISPQIS